jgi:protein SCO1/2
VREELANAMHPYPAAVASQVLLRVEGLTTEWRDLLIAAQNLLKLNGMPLVIGRYPLDIEGPHTTADRVIGDVLERIRFVTKQQGVLTPRGSVGLKLDSVPAHRQTASLLDIEMEDHNGDTLKFREFFIGKPTFVFFFYTRCNNPQKCSSNVWRWGELVKSLVENGMDCRTAGISYDPAFDSAERLRSYATDRVVPLDESHRAFRVPGDFIAFRRGFALNVNYSQTTVNQHAVEAFVFNSEGKIAHSFVRATWSTEEVLQALKDLHFS